MADKETIILDFQVEQGSAIAELERTKKSIIQLKQEQQELTKAYKAGDVTLEEYASESVRLDGILKKQQSTYTNVQKSVTGVKTKMDDLIASNNKLASSVKASTENIRVGGVTVGELGTKITALANPVTAAVTLVGALGAAYARSSIGAKDLEFATNQLSFATTIVTDKFARLFSSVEDGEGIVSKFVGSAIFRIAGLDAALLSKLAANANEELEQIGRDRLKVEAEVQDKLSENAELLTDIANKETSVNDKRAKAQQIQDNLTDIANARLGILNRQEVQEKIIGATIANKEELERKLNEIEFQRGRITKEETKQKEKIEKQVNAIINAENKALEIEREKTIQSNKRIKQQDEARERELFSRDVSFDDSGLGPKEFDPQEQLEEDKELIDEVLGLTKSAEDEKRAELLRTNALKDQLAEEDFQRAQEQLAMTESMLGQAAELFSEQTAAGKILSTATATINTYRGATLALASLPPPFSFIQAALTIATGLASIAKIQGVAAAGGADFVTNRPTMLLVGDNPGSRERVTVEPLSGRGQTRVFNGGIAMGGGGSLSVDGGAAKNAAVRETNQAILMANALKSMPKPVVSWIEGRDVGRRVEFKEMVSKA